MLNHNLTDWNIFCFRWRKTQIVRSELRSLIQFSDAAAFIMLLHFHFTNDIHFAAASHCKSIRNCIQIEMDIGNRTILSIFFFYTTGISLFSLFSLKALSFSSFHTLFFQHVQKIENSSRKKCIWMYHTHTRTHTRIVVDVLCEPLFFSLYLG